MKAAMKSVYLIVGLALFSIVSPNRLFAQNLVPNGSFESYTDCPLGWSPWGNDYMVYATGWRSFGDTPDFLHICGAPDVSIPQNVMGYEVASSGNGYAGIICYTYSDFEYRELIGYQLSSPLMKDSCYEVSFKLSLADSAVQKINRIGVTFTKNGAYSQYDRFPKNNFAHLMFDCIDVGKTGWTTFTGYFIADSTYDYIVLGNFFLDDHMVIEHLNDGGTLPVHEQTNYYYVDDIVVELNNSVTGVDKSFDENEMLIFPNPTNGKFSILLSETDGEEYQLLIENSLGQLVQKESIKGHSLSTQTFEIIEKGWYFVHINTPTKKSVKKIFVK